MKPYGLMSAAFVVAALFLIVSSTPKVVHAAEKTARIGVMEPRIMIYGTSLSSTPTSFTAYAETFTKGVYVAVADVDGDGTQDIVTGAGRGGGPEVRVFSSEGSLRNRFFAYATNFHGGVRVAAHDLDGDGKSEIITAPGPGGGPEVKIFSSDGTLRKKFFAYDVDFRGGVNVTVGAFGQHHEPRIVTGTGLGASHVRFFSSSGKEMRKGLRPFGESMNGVTVAAVPVENGKSMLAVAEERLSAPVVKVYDLNSASRPKATFSAEASSYRGGVTLSANDLDGDGISELVVGIGPGKPSKVKVYSVQGVPKDAIEPFAKNFIGGSNVAAGKGMLVVGPSAVAVDGRTDLYKYIHVDLSSQTLKYYENGRLIGMGRVSTGKWSTPTPIGTFAIKNKIPVAYSKPYDLYMEWWMAFTPDGSYGLHAFPFWKTKGGGKRYEGASHLGTPVSHGCIRQTIDEAKALYKWATIGTPVIVTR